MPHALALRRASECALRARSSELMIEKKKPLKAQLAGELAAAADDAERTSIRVQSFPASPATCHATHSDRLALLLLGRI